jgi:hypothetical protein
VRLCDLCNAEPIARVALLRGRSEDRVWLCTSCFGRYEDHELEPAELLALVRLTARRRGRCEWCTELPPSTQARIPVADGRIFAFWLCTPCAREAKEQGGSVLTGQTAIAGDARSDPRYDHALEVARRRRGIRRIK